MCLSAAQKSFCVIYNNAQDNFSQAEKIFCFRGQICATVSSVATIIAGAYEAVYGNPLQGIAVGLAGILVPAFVFIYNKEACIRELKEKQKLMNQIQ